MVTEIRKILIANRAEIAVRIIDTCRNMGIATIAVFAEGDRDLPFVQLADESYSLGDGPLADTYLNGEKIVMIAKRAGANAIHPGYGFLSENAGFCAFTEAAGLIFIGPSAKIISLMGDKISSRETAQEAGVPLIPGYNGEDQNPDTLKAEAEKIGYPVLIKASAGGGGKGMRIVEKPEDFLNCLDEAQGEAQSSFGDSRVFIERYITQPRHIEVQVFSDVHGEHIHMFERECSIQRRHQKIVEESPSTALHPSLRDRICSTAVNIARHINYRGAGTVEFIMDNDGRYYFLEMNTRLQVEHPVTELVTGQDMVKWQILIAEGRALPVRQNDLRQIGHAIEVRIYAEDPDNHFLPTTGTIEHVGYPRTHSVRFENGYGEGNEVTVNYDPMLAKVAVFAETRRAAARKLSRVLDDIQFIGVKTNRAYLQRVLKHEAFLAGDTFTSFTHAYEEELRAPALSDDDKAAGIASFLLTGQDILPIADAPGNNDNSPWRSNNLQRFRNA